MPYEWRLSILIPLWFVLLIIFFGIFIIRTPRIHKKNFKLKIINNDTELSFVAIENDIEYEIRVVPLESKDWQSAIIPLTVFCSEQE